MVRPPASTGRVVKSKNDVTLIDHGNSANKCPPTDRIFLIVTMKLIDLKIDLIPAK